ncbi:hypothetical protein AAMO2058_001417800 [Amorphochlora amoebiformis]|mmetsp:Transcript_15268/g.24159  ORF Transcript_15268/g.24159 Transcript_15268/m.24159 type:complete len:96 (-) Transcript_15268:158-445(-)
MPHRSDPIPDPQASIDIFGGSGNETSLLRSNVSRNRQSVPSDAEYENPATRVSSNLPNPDPSDSQLEKSKNKQVRHRVYMRSDEKIPDRQLSPKI